MTYPQTGYDKQLRHYADMRITLDLDDGVKVVTGGKDEE